MGNTSGIRLLGQPTHISTIIICRSTGNWANTTSQRKSIKSLPAMGSRISLTILAKLNVLALPYLGKNWQQPISQTGEVGAGPNPGISATQIHKSTPRNPARSLTGVVGRLGTPEDYRRGVQQTKPDYISLLDDAAGSAFPRFRERLETAFPRFRERLETESLELTSIGNNHQIRHAEVTQEKLENTEHIDYLFHRLFSMIQLILKTKRT